MKHLLDMSRTLRSLDPNPLERILEQQNSGNRLGTKPICFLTSSLSSKLAHLINMETDGSSIRPFLLQQLQPFLQKGWLTIYNGTDHLPDSLQQ